MLTHAAPDLQIVHLAHIVPGINLKGIASLALRRAFTTCASIIVIATYDELGRVVSRGIDSTNYVGTTFDALGRVTNVTNALAPASPGFQYGYVNTPNPSSRLASVTYPSGTGLSTSYTYYGNSIGDGTGNDDQRLSELKNMSGTNQLSDFKYTYNHVGTIAAWTQQTNSSSTGATNSFTYDNADQLTHDTQSGGATNAYGYYYDPAGNRLAGSVNGATTAGQFNVLNQLTRLSGSTTSTTVAGHSTGHQSRLARTFGDRFGSELYSKEELIAEMGAAFLSALAGVATEHTERNTTAYIQSWIAKLEEDNRLIVQAAGKAQKAVDYILGEPMEGEAAQKPELSLVSN
jgi:YD repeat-containing protein